MSQAHWLSFCRTNIGRSVATPLASLARPGAARNSHCTIVRPLHLAPKSSTVRSLTHWPSRRRITDSASHPKDLYKMTSSLANRFEHAGEIYNEARTSLIKPDPKLDHAVTNSAANGLPAITVSELQGQYLAIQCQLINAKSVLEIGTLGGYSTIWFARTGAKVTSIEINPKHRDVALENTKGFDVDIVLGAALDVLQRFVGEGRKFDFIFIDAAWEEQWEYFELAVKLARANGCIYVDNVVRQMIEDRGEGGGSETLLTRVGRVGKVSATLVTTLSGHKRNPEDNIDGFLLAVVKE